MDTKNCQEQKQSATPDKFDVSIVKCGKMSDKLRLRWISEQLTDSEAAIVCQYVLNILNSRPKLGTCIYHGGIPHEMDYDCREWKQIP